MDTAALRQKAQHLPTSPGVYIMKNKTGVIIYIGKAKSLRDRVGQYFAVSAAHEVKTAQMVAHVHAFEYVITDSEFEALVLECSLIKQHQPKYNILLKDDKGYHYIKVTNEPWPRLLETKQQLPDGALYIGPYMSGFVTSNAVDAALKIFKLPRCNRNFTQKHRRPCLNFHINQCSAPCQGNISRETYSQDINDAVAFLKSGGEQVTRDFTKKMEEAARYLNFEQAATLRDKIAAIRKIKTAQKVVSSPKCEQDVIALVQSKSKSYFEVFRFSKGRLFDREDFQLHTDEAPSAVSSQFLGQYYSLRERIPPEIFINFLPDNMENLVKMLSQKAARAVKIVVPQKGPQLKLLEMCRNNAAERAAQRMDRTFKEAAALDELAKVLSLEKAPEIIESYDISHTGGAQNVAGMIVLKDGRFVKNSYRKFKIQSFSGQDDYASMREVISRRLDEYEKGGDDACFSNLPDLILLDGGKGQVAAVQAVLQARGYKIPTFGMVKDGKHRTRAIASGGEEISLGRTGQAFNFVARIQDEVHRFAIGFHRQLRKKNLTDSELLKIPGVGRARAKALFLRFGTLEHIKAASLKELEDTPSMSAPSADAVFKYFRISECEKN